MNATVTRPLGPAATLATESGIPAQPLNWDIAGIRRDFLGLVIHPQIGDVYDEPIDAHRRHRPNARHIAVDRRQMRKAIGNDDAVRQFDKFPRFNRIGFRLRHGQCSASSALG